MADGSIIASQDITVNGVTVGAGSGTENTLMGTDALKDLTTGNSNVAFGTGALHQVSDNKNNTAIGYYAGSNLIVGDNNILIGNNAQPSNSTVSNEVTIGNSAVTVVRMGNGSPLTTTTYVQEQLAIKDKLIEKLSARLDSLEKKVK